MITMLQGWLAETCSAEEPNVIRSSLEMGVAPKLEGGVGVGVCVWSKTRGRGKGFMCWIKE